MNRLEEIKMRYRRSLCSVQLADDIEYLLKRIEKLEKAIQWVLEDVGYKPPEALGCKDVQDRWFMRLKQSLAEGDKL